MAGVTVERAVQIAHECHRAGRLVEAERLCCQVLAVRPDCAPALNLLGILAYTTGQTDAAAELFRRAVVQDGGVAEYHANLGNVLRVVGRLDDAVAAYQAALAIAPDSAAIHSNLGGSLSAQGDVGRAVEAYRTAIRLDPRLVAAHSNLGNALVDAGRLAEAMAAYRTAVSLAPDEAEAQWNLAMCLLLAGDFEQGWPAFEWRLRCVDAGRAARRFSQPRWSGEALAGRTILLHAEQGLGDTIQFIRYAALVAGRGGRVVVECQRELIHLLRQLPQVAEWVAYGQPLPAFDVHCPLLSLPARFNNPLDDLPQQDPPLRVPTDRAERWLGRLAGRRSIGLVWAGSAGHANDHRRSIPLAVFAPLWQALPDVGFVSLQVGPAAAQAPACPGLLDVGPELGDFADTAAVIEQLDLVITVDTAVAHLAAAMGQATWVLLPFSPDWRWQLDRDDSPWYPSVRLYRQRQPDDWPEVVSRVAADLGRRARDRPQMSWITGFDLRAGPIKLSTYPRPDVVSPLIARGGGGVVEVDPRQQVRPVGVQATLHVLGHVQAVHGVDRAGAGRDEHDRHVAVVAP